MENVATREAFCLTVLEDFLKTNHAIDLCGVTFSVSLGNIIQMIGIFSWGCIFYDECRVLRLKWDNLSPGRARAPIDFPSSWLLARRKRQVPSQDALNAACTA